MGTNYNFFGRTNQIKTSFFWSNVHDTEGEVTIMECTMVTHDGIHFSITNNKHVIWKIMENDNKIETEIPVIA